MEPNVTLITLGVRDLERAVRFYRDGLGWQKSNSGDDEVAFFQGTNVVVALWLRDRLVSDAEIGGDDGSGFGGIALAHNVASRDQVDAALAEAEAAGGTILKPAIDTGWGGYAGYFADPDGHAWEVAWNPFFPMDGGGRLRLPD